MIFQSATHWVVSRWSGRHAGPRNFFLARRLSLVAAICTCLSRVRHLSWRFCSGPYPRRTGLVPACAAVLHVSCDQQLAPRHGATQQQKQVRSSPPRCPVSLSSSPAPPHSAPTVGAVGQCVAGLFHHPRARPRLRRRLWGRTCASRRRPSPTASPSYTTGWAP